MDPELAQVFGRTADRVAELEELPVGVGLLAGLLALQSAPTDAETAVREHALWTKIESLAAAKKMIAAYDAVHGLHGMLEADAQHEAQMLAAQEIACATHVAYATAMSHLSLVETVAASLPASWEALDRGQITLAHMKVIEKATRSCNARVTQAVDAQVTGLAVERAWTPGETAKAARKLVIALDPEGAEDRAKAAKDDADVRFYPGDDETATVSATGDAVLARQIMDAINDRAEAMSRDGDDRLVGVRRFDALADLVLGDTVSRPAASRGTTLVRVELTALLGQNDHPGELVGYGPITADTARKLAADSMLRRMVTDPMTGDTLDLGRSAYRPSSALRRLIQASHPTCTMAGCSRPSIHCEIDHRREHHDGGRTDRCNLKPLCKMHHQMKTKGRWRVDQHPDGSETWTSYLGHQYVKYPSYFDLPDPLAPDDDLPEDIADHLPAELLDPYPSINDVPLPEPPPLLEEDYEAMSYALDTLGAMDITFRQWVDKHWDEARATGLVA